LAKMQFYGGGVVLQSALAGIDQALWDIAGKTYGVPVHALLGGHVRDRVRVYAQLHGDTKSEIHENAVVHREHGLTAVKLGPGNRVHDGLNSADGLRSVVDRMESAREALGPDIDVAIDFHGRLSVADARRVIPMLEDTLPLFVEEPIRPELSAQLRSVVSGTRVPIAVGERLYSRWDFADAFNAGIAVAQPDLSHAGGISEVRRIAAAAEMHDIAIAPHCPLGPIALAACLQIDFATPNFLIQEELIHLGYQGSTPFLDYLVDTSAFEIVDGFIERFTGPGLGVEIDESAVRAASRSFSDSWHVPMIEKTDGSHFSW
jgi:galactonate dehydratase